MNRKIIQDVVFPSKRQQQESFPQKGEVAQSVAPEEVIMEPREEESFLPKLTKKQTSSSMGDMVGGGFNRTNKSPRIVLWTITGIVLILATGILFSRFFSGATVKIVPLNQIVELNAEFLSRENSVEPKILSYQRIALPIEELSEVVTETIEKQVSKKASGKIRIYNDYSSANQRLIKNTRFESTAGKIYRIDGSVDVPGATVSQGKAIPGSVEVTVYADAPGESYNSAPTDFSIPGFKGDPRYGKFYARSETPLEGGFAGTVKVPTPEAKASATAKLNKVLEDELMQKALAQVPEGFILYPDVSFVVFDELNNNSSDSTSAKVSSKGAFYGIIFEKSALSSFIAEKTLTAYDGSAVLVRNIGELTLTPKTKITDPAGLTDLTFTLSGSPHIVWVVDVDKLKEDLRNIDKRDGFQKIVGAQGAVKKAEAKILPFWRKVFPDNAQDIKVEVSLE